MSTLLGFTWLGLFTVTVTKGLRVLRALRGTVTERIEPIREHVRHAAAAAAYVPLGHEGRKLARGWSGKEW